MYFPRRNMYFPRLFIYFPLPFIYFGGRNIYFPLRFMFKFGMSSPTSVLLQLNLHSFAGQKNFDGARFAGRGWTGGVFARNAQQML